MTRSFPFDDYDLAATLESGQVFRWSPRGHCWEGVLGTHWIRLWQTENRLHAETATPSEPWDSLLHFLGTTQDLAAIRSTFPDDAPMRDALAACPGLRLLRQDPWECLASFILSSTKQIVQIRQCVSLLCERFGQSVPVPPGIPPAYSFPTAARLAEAEDQELRECKLGFRARYLGGTARRIARGGPVLEDVAGLPTAEGRRLMMEFPGVGRKIADCVLLFAYGRQDAFPVDVWVHRALRQLYFPNRRPSPQMLERFAATHFGPFAGYAQQYLFHYVRTHLGRTAFSGSPTRRRSSAVRRRTHSSP